MSKYPNIPEFGDVDGMMLAVRAMKDILEQMAGQRQGDALGAPTTYVQPSRPTLSRGVVLKKGDLWIDSGTDRLYYWSGIAWRQVMP
jgi:hypothetical protein